MCKLFLKKTAKKNPAATHELQDRAGIDRNTYLFFVGLPFKL